MHTAANDASFTLAGYLLEAQDESTAILAAMQVGNDLLGAEGCAFVPFNEWKQSMPALKYGEADFLQNMDWQARLSAPATRHACRICEGKQAGADCVLLQEPADAQNVVLCQPALWRAGDWRHQLFLFRTAESERRPTSVPGRNGAPDRFSPGCPAHT